jgi:GTP-binding protein
MIKDIRNIAIIAHVDHGKTTLVDGILKQTHTFRENEAEMSQTTIMDSNAQEKERGITILAKNTAVFYRDVKINIIDTPGHADFGGEVERVLGMADAALLIVDAAEGPLPQTKFVLKKALGLGMKVIVVVNKIDKKDARPEEVLHETEELFLKLATHDDHLSFPVIYAIGRDGKAGLTPSSCMQSPDLTPLFELILKEVPNSVTKLDEPLKLQIANLDYDPHLGKIGIGRIHQGQIKVGQSVSLLDPNKKYGNYRIEKLFTSLGMKREEVIEAPCGDIVAISGIEDLSIGQTVADSGADVTSALPLINIEEPTLKVTIGANTSPLAGKEGKFVTSRQVGERLLREKQTNLGLRIYPADGGAFTVIGRGELHLAVLMENMRREGYEIQVSKPEVIIKNDQEPFEEVTIDVPDEYVGVVSTEMGRRRATMLDMAADSRGSTRMVFEISQRNMMGTRNILLTNTKGTVLFNTMSLGYRPTGTPMEKLRNGVLVSTDFGKSMAYSLENAQERGVLFIGPGVDVYEGMIIGLNSRDQDMDINVTKGQAKTNVRSATKDMKIALTAPIEMSIDQALDFIEDDELIEITPQNVRLRKKFLSKLDRTRASRIDRSSS